MSRAREEHRTVFLEHYGRGPWPCWGCAQPVNQRQLRVHHLDHDHSNNVVTNLVPMHVGCHVRHHLLGHPGRMTGRRHSEATRHKMSLSQRRAYAEGRGGMSRPESRAKLSATRRGRPGHPHSPEARAKIGEAARRTRLSEQVQCDQCPLVSNAGAIARHKKARHP